MELDEILKYYIMPAVLFSMVLGIVLYFSVATICPTEVTKTDGDVRVKQRIGMFSCDADEQRIKDVLEAYKSKRRAYDLDADDFWDMYRVRVKGNTTVPDPIRNDAMIIQNMTGG